MISPADISVVVQGLIVGKPGDPPEQRYTLRCLNSIRRHLPGAQIVLSTWQGSDLSGLPYDILVESEDPGAYNLRREGVAPFLHNINRQITTTKAGLEAATRPYAMKIRSDMLLTGDGFLSYLGKYRMRNQAWKILRERVVTSTVYARNPRREWPAPFHPSDWFFVGRREDLLDIWDIPLAPEPETSRWFDTRPLPSHDPDKQSVHRYNSEQYVWVTFLRKHGEVPFMYRSDLSHDAINLSELTLANNLVMVEMEQLGIKFLKYSLPKSQWASLYTHGEWLRMYKKYCDGSVRLRPDVTLWRKSAIRAHRAVLASEWPQRLKDNWQKSSPASLGVAKRIFSTIFKPEA